MSENEKFEVWAQQFRKETGIWPPGKSRPRGMLPQDESTIRAEFFANWLLHRWIPVAARLPERPKYWGKKIWAIVDGEILVILYYGKKLGMTHWKLIILPESEAQSEV